MNKDALEMYKNGYPANVVAEKYKISEDSIWYWAKKMGIKRRTKFRKKKHSIDDYYFSDINSPIKSYFLGYLLADGSITKDKNNRTYLRFHCHKNDEPILKEFKEQTQATQPITKDRKGYLCMCISSQQMIEDLSKYKIQPNKTYDTSLKIPEKLPFIQSFILGFLDGDGCVTKDGFIFGSNSLNLLEDIQRALPTSKAKGSLKPKKENGFYELRYGGKVCSKEIFDYLYSVDHFCLKRKKVKHWSYENDSSK